MYYPLHQGKNAKRQDHKQQKGGSVNVYLWGAVIDPSKLHIRVEDHQQFKDVCLVTLRVNICYPQLSGVPYMYVLAQAAKWENGDVKLAYLK